MKRFFQKSIVAAVPLLLFSYSAACAQDQSASGGAPLDTLEKRASWERRWILSFWKKKGIFVFMPQPFPRISAEAAITVPVEFPPN